MYVNEESLMNRLKWKVGWEDMLNVDIIIGTGQLFIVFRLGFGFVRLMTLSFVYSEMNLQIVMEPVPVPVL